MSIEEENRIRFELKSFTRNELNDLAEKKLRMEGAYRFKSKKELIDEILKQTDSKKLHSILNPPKLMKWWDRREVKIFGWISIIGTILTITFYFFPSTNPEVDEIRLETSGNQSPAIHSDGSVTIDYGNSATAPVVDSSKSPTKADQATGNSFVDTLIKENKNESNH